MTFSSSDIYEMGFFYGQGNAPERINPDLIQKLVNDLKGWAEQFGCCESSTGTVEQVIIRAVLQYIAHECCDEPLQFAKIAISTQEKDFYR